MGMRLPTRSWGQWRHTKEKVGERKQVNKMAKHGDKVKRFL